MKKSVFMLLFLFVGLFSFSQVKVGVFGKLNYSILAKDKVGFDDDHHFKANIGGGISVDVPFSKHVYLSNEAEYIRKGSLINRSSESNSRFRLNMPYAVVGSTLNYEVGAISLGAGGYAGYLVNNMNIGHWSYDNHIKEFNENEFHRMDYGLKFRGRINLADAAYFTLGSDLGLRAVADEHRPMGDSETRHRFANKLGYAQLTIVL